MIFYIWSPVNSINPCFPVELLHPLLGLKRASRPAQVFHQYHTMHCCLASPQFLLLLSISQCNPLQLKFLLLISNVLHLAERWNVVLNNILRATKMEMWIFPWRRWPSPRERLGSHPSCFLIIFFLCILIFFAIIFCVFKFDPLWARLGSHPSCSPIILYLPALRWP